MPLDLKGFYPDNEPNKGLYKIADTLEKFQERKYEMDYRHQKDLEADQWRKANLIQDLTDLSKHQTGNDVADALGNKLMNDVFQKYTQNASKISPLELQAGIQKDMSGIIQGMDKVGNELATADKQLAIIKQLHPEINSAQLYDDYRKDIVRRHLNETGDGFNNQMQVQPSSFDLTNPVFLSKYVANTKGLDESIANPKGLESTTAVSGDPYTNVEYGAKIPFWMQPNFTDKDIKNGFLAKGMIPKLNIKSEELPSDFLPALRGQQRKIVTSDVHRQFMDERAPEVIAGTRAMFPGYDNMNDAEKELAERDYLYNKISSLDKSQFAYKSSKTPSASMIKLWTGGGQGNSGELTINDVYGEIDNSLKDWEFNSSSFMPFRNLPQDAKEVILPKVKANTGEDLKQDDLQIIRGNDNSIRVFDKDGKFKMIVEKKNTNIKAQVGVKQKDAVIKQSNGQEPQSMYNIKGKTYTKKQLNDMGYKDEDIAPYLKK